MQSRVAAVMAHSMQPEHSAAVLNWYDKPVGRAILQAELAAARQQARMQPDDWARASAVMNLKLTASRRALLDQLAQATQAAEGMYQITLNTTLAIQRGMALAAPDEAGPGPREIREQFQTHRTAMLAALTEMARTSMALSYHDLPDRHLREYLGFCRSPAGSQYQGLAMLAIDQALSQAVEDLMRSLPGSADQQNI
jgi:hypothetical protein